ncbi:hypothetical protein LY76DRAFT_161745 [Colletotrichum caudatum]|nr:hypothetical protein LY76DRAFT_161745 [Colletotrichum caudatum]
MGRASPNNRGPRFTHLLPLPKTHSSSYPFILLSPPCCLSPALTWPERPVKSQRNLHLDPELSPSPPGMPGEVPAPVTTPRGTNRISFPRSDQSSRAPTTAEHDGVITFDDSLWKDARRRQTLGEIGSVKAHVAHSRVLPQKPQVDRRPCFSTLDRVTGLLIRRLPPPSFLS